jgi:hypothetical protein
MANDDPVTTRREDELDEVIAQYLDSVGSGGPTDPGPWLERYPEHRAELSEFFRDYVGFVKTVSKFRRSARAMLRRLRS